METRAATTAEANAWLKYKTQFEGSTKPKIEALNLARAAGDLMATAVQEIGGNTVTIIDDDQRQRIANLVNCMNILDRQISGVIAKTYYIKFDDTGEIGIFGEASAPEADVFPSLVTGTSTSGFGAVGVLIAVGIAAVTLLGAGFITLKVLENQAQTETQKIMERMQAVDAEMMKLPDEKRKQWETWRKQAVEQVKATAKNIPGAQSLLSKLLGSRGGTMLIAGGVAIAAAYFLIPKLRRN